MKNKRKLIIWLFVGICIVLSPIAFLVAHNLQTINKEKNSKGVLKAALQLEFTKASLVNVSANPTELLLETHASKQLDVYMSQHGWHRVEPIQMGATHYFGKGQQKMTISSRQITARYRLYKLEKQP
jgi:hypothetical protein